MKKIVIEGNQLLSGTIKISGAKNSAVALIPAAILSDEITTILNVPNISDKGALVDIIKLLNCTVKESEDTLTIDSRDCKNKCIPSELSSKLRASYYFMGVLLSKFKKVEVYYPGGCNIGARQIDFHLKGFESLGATILMEDDKFTITAEELIGTPIFLDFPSVGATKNLMFAAVKAKGITTINNAAKEPEVVNVATFLNNMGAKIIGAGTNKITIEGVDHLGSAIIEVIPDRIEAATYLTLGALIGDPIKIDNIIPEHLEGLTDKLEEAGVNLVIGKKDITVSKPDYIKAVNVKTLVYPGFVTDMAQPFSVLMTQATGKSFLEETIHQNRMGQCLYLNNMGANIHVDGQIAFIEGPTKLKGQKVVATDLRAGASLIVAGLIAEGTTEITEIDHILRGYENIEQKLINVGAKIRTEDI